MQQQHLGRWIDVFPAGDGEVAVLTGGVQTTLQAAGGLCVGLARTLASCRHVLLEVHSNAWPKCPRTVVPLGFRAECTDECWQALVQSLLI